MTEDHRATRLYRRLGPNVGTSRSFAMVHFLVKLLFPRIRFKSQGVEVREPAVFVANHEGSFGPLSIYLNLPYRIHPWIMGTLFEPKESAAYLEKEFVRPELHFTPPLSTLVAGLIADVCGTLLRYTGAIPVYQKSRRLALTFRKSVEVLLRGENLLIFPEISGQSVNSFISRFDSGFLEVLRVLQSRLGQTLYVYPISVDRKARTLSLGEGIALDSGAAFRSERKRLSQELEERVTRNLAR